MSTLTEPLDLAFRRRPFDTGVSQTAEQLRSARANERSRQSRHSTQEREQAVQELFMMLVDAAANDEPIEMRSVAWAVPFLLDLPAWVPNPEASLDRDGHVFLEWDYGRRSVFSVSVSPNADLSYAGLFGISVSHGVEASTGEIPRSILEGIERALEQSSHYD